jgi:hypothetical protein
MIGTYIPIDIVLENKILDVSILMSELYIRFRWSPLVLFWSEYRRRRTNVRSPRYVRCFAMIYIHSSLNYFCNLFAVDFEFCYWQGTLSSWVFRPFTFAWLPYPFAGSRNWKLVRRKSNARTPPFYVAQRPTGYAGLFSLWTPNVYDAPNNGLLLLDFGRDPKSRKRRLGRLES